MELGPIFRSLMHNKVRFWLIALEVALTLAIVVNCITMVLDLRTTFQRDTGYDELNTLVVTTEPFGSQYADEDFLDTLRQADIERLESIPGAVAAMASSATPLSGGGSGTGRRASGSDPDADGVSVPYFVVTEGAVATFGPKIVAGRDFQSTDFDFETDEEGIVAQRNVIITQALADALFPGGDALGNDIQNREGQMRETIIGIVDHLQNFWLTSGVEDYTMLQPGRPGSSARVRYLVRTEPGARDAVAAGLEERMLEAEGDRLVTVKPLYEFKEGYYSDDLAVIKILTAVTLLMILVTSLGIIGLTSFSVTERRRQIGTRRALGATKRDIVRYFLVENWMITGCGLAAGVLFSLLLNYTLVQMAGMPKLDWRLLVGGMVLLWLTGIAAALAPALRATGVSPEVATRTV
ncbi:MAG: FtsX-like permease family protein [Acidobacteriota bacterium]